MLYHTYIRHGDDGEFLPSSFTLDMDLSPMERNSPIFLLHVHGVWKGGAWGFSQAYGLSHVRNLLMRRLSVRYRFFGFHLEGALAFSICTYLGARVKNLEVKGWSHDMEEIWEYISLLPQYVKSYILLLIMEDDISPPPPRNSSLIPMFSNIFIKYMRDMYNISLSWRNVKIPISEVREMIREEDTVPPNVIPFSYILEEGKRGNSC